MTKMHPQHLHSRQEKQTYLSVQALLQVIGCGSQVPYLRSELLCFVLGSAQILCQALHLAPPGNNLSLHNLELTLQTIRQDIPTLQQHFHCVSLRSVLQAKAFTKVFSI